MPDTSPLPAHRERFPYKMKELSELTGLPRQAIHFYIQQGLLPPGHKTGRNMAFYGPEHVERVRLIKRLQHERFLPLKAIKAMLDGRDEHFSEAQQSFLVAVRAELGSTLARNTESERTLLDPAPLLEAHGLTEEDLRTMIEIGVVGASKAEDGPLRIALEDAWVLENFGRMRAAGFTEELGFSVADMAPYAELVDAVLARDVELIGRRLSERPPTEAARMLERAMPLIHEFLTRYHARRVNDFLSSI
ncbi:MAG: hypothetical protein DRJ42_13145 [Deltaproteobacteria bacterium]|nr:MAG: hypothetical protein DRJ42_13145 [Deltaproteobacteria bacterium]